MAGETEYQITLEDIDPLTLYGVNNVKYNLLAKAFPGLKITARDTYLAVSGTPKDIERFSSIILQATNHYHRYGELTQEQLEWLLEGRVPARDTEEEAEEAVLLYGPNGRVIKARTQHQHELIMASATHDLVFAVGPAGTGKTYTAIALAVNAIKHRAVRRIILTRPAVEAGERLGFLPGDMKDKLDPYLQPLYDALNDMLPPNLLNTKLEEGSIQIAPLAYMRGRTLDNAFVILDEAQNATKNQIKMFLTRMGRNAKFIVTGDITQIDLPRYEASGLPYALKVLKNIKGIQTVYFDTSDIVRHALVVQIVEAFEKAHSLQEMPPKAQDGADNSENTQCI